MTKYSYIKAYTVVRLNRDTVAARRYLVAIAEFGDGPQQTAEVSARLGTDQRRTALVRQNLIDVKGLIYSPRRGYVDFTAPCSATTFGDSIRLNRCSRAPPWTIITLPPARGTDVRRRQHRPAAARGASGLPPSGSSREICERLGAQASVTRM